MMDRYAQLGHGDVELKEAACYGHQQHGKRVLRRFAMLS